MPKANTKAQSMISMISAESNLIPVEFNWIQMETTVRPLRIEFPHAMIHVTSPGDVRQGHLDLVNG